MELTEEQIQTLTPDEKMSYYKGLAKKYLTFFKGIENVPDIFELAKESPENQSRIVDQFDQLSEESRTFVEHIPKRFRP